MKEMIIEKEVELHQEFESVEGIRCFLRLDYIAEEKGIRALGIIEVEGKGVRNGLFHEFNEEIELDILAPYSKIDDEKGFRVLLDQWDYKLKNDILNLRLCFMVNGLKEEKEEQVFNAEIKQEAVIEDLLDDQNNVKEIQKYVIAQMNDSYQSIAERYNISEKELIVKNHNKQIEYKSLILLP